MNRYLIDGITRDLIGGKRIVFVGLLGEADSLHRAVLDSGIATRRIVETNGRKRIELPSGGTLTCRSCQRCASRGFSADVVVVDPDVRRNPELMEAIIPMIAGHGELIVASF